MKKYKKKPIIIEAIQVTGKNGFEITQWSNGLVNNNLQIKTLEGVMTANIGDYIIKGIKGEFYPCKPDIFEATYEDL
jgi:hypothetical protein